MIRLAGGDRSALPRVASGLDGPVRAFCAKLLGPGADAEDAAQEALLELFARASDFERTGDVLAWALTIAAWECRTVRRRTSRSRTSSLAADPPSEAAGPDTTLEERRLREAFAAAVLELSPSDRAVLEDVLAERGQGPTFRKRKERMLDRIRTSQRRLYGHDG